MSGIASFYIREKDKSVGLIAAAEAQSKALRQKRWGFFRPKFPLNPDPLWEFIRRETHRLDEFPYSGFLLLDVQFLVPNILSSDDEIGKRLSETTQSTWISYPKHEAIKVMQSIEQTDLSYAAIKKFLAEQARANDYPRVVQPLLDSVKRLTDWLRAVTEIQVGILNIG
jgi:hypothetical protein